MVCKNHLLVNELPHVLSISGKTYSLAYGESLSGDVNMLESRDCYFCLLMLLFV